MLSARKSSYLLPLCASGKSPNCGPPSQRASSESSSTCSRTLGGLRTQGCHCRVGLIPGPGTSTCQGQGQKGKETNKCGAKPTNGAETCGGGEDKCRGKLLAGELRNQVLPARAVSQKYEISESIFLSRKGDDNPQVGRNICKPSI